MAQGKSFTDMVNRIVADLGQRTDLAAQVIPNAIRDAVEVYQKNRFRWNENRPLTPFTLTMVPGQAIYTAADDARIPLLMHLDYINYILGSVNQRIERADPETVYLALQTPGTQSGQPELWAYDGNSLVFYPEPSIAYVLTIGGYLAVAAPTDLTDTTNVWMNEAEMLIRSRAKYEIALHVTRNKEMIAMMSPDEGSGGACERYFAMLLAETNRVKGLSRMKAMRF